MPEKEKHPGARTEHSKKIRVNEKLIDIPNAAPDKCAEPISELSNRFLNEGN